MVALWIQEGEDYGWIDPLIKVLQIQEVSVVGVVVLFSGLFIISIVKKDPWLYTRGRHIDTLQACQSDKVALEATVKDLTADLRQARRDYEVSREQVIRWEEREAAWRHIERPKP